MSKSIEKSNVYQILKTIKHPEIPQHNIVELSMIPLIEIEEENVQVTLALPSMDAPIKQDLVDLIKKTVAKMKEKPNVQVKLTEMNADQRAAFMSFVRKAKIINQTTGKIGKVLAVMSGKGGVGKSSVAGLLAASLRRQGLRVGILDADITGPSIPMMFGAHQRPMQSQEGLFPIESRTGIKLMSINLLLPNEDQPVVWRGPLISKTIEQFWADITWGDLDYLVVDLPPGTADAALTVMQSLPLDGILLVTSPQDLAGMVVRKAANMAKAIGIPVIGLVENMSHIVCPECGTHINVFGISKAENTARMIEAAMLAHIPLDPKFSELCDKGAIEDYESEIFEKIAKNIVDGGTGE